MHVDQPVGKIDARRSRQVSYMPLLSVDAANDTSWRLKGARLVQRPCDFCEDLKDVEGLMDMRGDAWTLDSGVYTAYKMFGQLGDLFRISCDAQLGDARLLEQLRAERFDLGVCVEPLALPTQLARLQASPSGSIRVAWRSSRRLASRSTSPCTARCYCRTTRRVSAFRRRPLSFTIITQVSARERARCGEAVRTRAPLAASATLSSFYDRLVNQLMYIAQHAVLDHNFVDRVASVFPRHGVNSDVYVSVGVRAQEATGERLQDMIARGSYYFVVSCGWLAVYVKRLTRPSTLRTPTSSWRCRGPSRTKSSTSAASAVVRRARCAAASTASCARSSTAPSVALFTSGRSRPALARSVHRQLCSFGTVASSQHMPAAVKRAFLDTIAHFSDIHFVSCSTSSSDLSALSS